MNAMLAAAAARTVVRPPRAPVPQEPVWRKPPAAPELAEARRRVVEEVERVRHAAAEARRRVANLD
jgi:hypothetical protein